MKILIRDIPRLTKRKDLFHFVSSAMKSPWYKGFAKNGEVMSCEIVSIKDRNTGEIHYHGIVDVTPMPMALKVVTRLSDCEFMGKPAIVRAWKDRSDQGDRRLHKFQENRTGYDRRFDANDRRRNALIRTVSDGGPDSNKLRKLTRIYTY